VIEIYGFHRELDFILVVPLVKNINKNTIDDLSIICNKYVSWGW